MKRNSVWLVECYSENRKSWYPVPSSSYKHRIDANLEARKARRCIPNHKFRVRKYSADAE